MRYVTVTAMVKGSRDGGAVRAPVSPNESGSDPVTFLRGSMSLLGGSTRFFLHCSAGVVTHFLLLYTIEQCAVLTVYTSSKVERERLFAVCSSLMSEILPCLSYSHQWCLEETRGYVWGKSQRSLRVAPP